MKYRLFILVGEKRVAEDVELDRRPVPGSVLELPDGRRFGHVVEMGPPHSGYDGLFAVDPIPTAK